MPSSDQLLKHEGWGLISPTREGIGEVVQAYRRTDVVRVLPDGFQEKELRKLANLDQAPQYLDRERRQGCTPGGEVDFEEAREGYC